MRLVEGVYLDGELLFSDNSKRKVEATGRGFSIDIAVDTVMEGGSVAYLR